MFLSRYSSLATVIIIALAVAVSSAPAFCAEAETQEQNLALLKAIDANLAKKPDCILFQLQHAEMMGRLKRYDEQIIEANKLLSKNPNLRDAYLIRSDGEANQKRYAEALVSLDKAFKLGSPTPKLLLQKARYLRNEKKYETAIAVLDPLIALEPPNIDAYKCRSACYFYLHGPCDKALQDMEKVVLLNPSDSIAVGLVADLKRELKSQALTKGK